MSKGFSSFTQFDNRFKGADRFSQDRSACPFFSLITAQNFLTNLGTEQKHHEDAIYYAVSSYIMVNPPKYMGFEELMLYASMSTPPDILATTCELVASDVIGFDSFFPDAIKEKENYCTIFLKNSNFFVVLVKHIENTTIYSVRDCHHDMQSDFQSLEALKTYMNSTYRLNVPTVIDGVPIPEFDNIEFVVLNEGFCTLF